MLFPKLLTTLLLCTLPLLLFDELATLVVVTIDRVACEGEYEPEARLAVIGWSEVEGGAVWEEPGCRGNCELCFTLAPLLVGDWVALVGALGAVLVGVVLDFG